MKEIEVYAKRPDSEIYFHLSKNSSTATIIESKLGFSGSNSIPMTTFALTVRKGIFKVYLLKKK